MNTCTDYDCVSLCFWHSKWKADRAAVTALCVSPDGKLLLSAGQVIKMWDLETKEVYRVSLAVSIFTFIDDGESRFTFKCSCIIMVTVSWSWGMQSRTFPFFRAELTELSRSLLFFSPSLFLSVEIHRPLHSRDDPALRHHATPRQQRPLLPVGRRSRSTAQRMVSRKTVARWASGVSGNVTVKRVSHCCPARDNWQTSPSIQASSRRWKGQELSGVLHSDGRASAHRPRHIQQQGRGQRD